jgi:hypothetical protein
MTEQQPVQTLLLDNGQTLLVRDLSRSISKDAVVVIMEAEIVVPVSRQYLSDRDLESIPGGFEGLRARVGETARFQYRAERNFILLPERQKVFDSLVATFTDTLLTYLSSQSFPGRLILKTHRDLTKKPRLSR